jgi:pre-mRNA-splicing factor ATP-dependent RNA helicase DHX15/PRP43
MKDILDKKGKGLNFLTQQPYSDNYKKLAEKWSQLPIYTDKTNVKTFLKLLDEKQVILLSAGTSSGKTVIVPKLLLKYIITNEINGMVAITNPKIITTFTAAEYGAATLDVKLGEEVGYKYKGSPIDSISDKTRLLYLTDGLLFAQISSDKYLEKYAGVIIDEAHERNVQIDLLLKLLKEVVLHRKDFKLIIMSATINLEVFRNYYNIDNIKYGEISISGAPNYPITPHWASVSINTYNYMKQIIEICNKIIQSKNPQDIIVFVPTIKDAFIGCNEMSKYKDVFCVEMFSQVSQLNRELAKSKDLFKKQGYKIKIIFATNVAESSITFDGLVYVIDTGLELVKEYDADTNMYVLKKDFTSQAQITQRIGRTGRTLPGIAYHLYTEELFNKLPKYPKPSILTTDLTETILSLINYGITIKNAMTLINDLITIPLKQQIDNVLHKLKFTKCVKIDDDNGVLTRIGKSILKFRSTHLLQALSIIMSYYLQCQNEMIIIMAIMELTDGTIEKLFNYSNDNKTQFVKYINKYSYKNSDHLTAYNIYTKLYQNNKMKYLNLQIFNKIDNYIKDLTKSSTIITPNNYDYMNTKYFMIDIEPFTLLEDNIIYILGKSYEYNLIQNNKTVNYINEITAKISFDICTTYDKNINVAICHTLINKFGKKRFIGITALQ